MSGTLFGIGVGPGAPDLLTLRAFRLLTGARVIAYPAPDTGESFARSIVADVIRPDQLEIPIIVPMRVERFPAASIYDAAAKQISSHLDAGTDVCVLCEGDPFFYGSFMYLFERLAGDYQCEIVPGVSSVMAGAAAMARPLSARNDVMTILPGPLPDAELRGHIESADSLIIMKVGRHLPRIVALLESLGLLDKSVYLERVTLDEQRVMPLADMAGQTAPYFSMISIYKGAESWIGDLRIGKT